MLRPTRHVYLDLPALTPQLQAYITRSSQAGGWSSNCVQVRFPAFVRLRRHQLYCILFPVCLWHGGLLGRVHRLGWIGM